MRKASRQSSAGKHGSSRSTLLRELRERLGGVTRRTEEEDVFSCGAAGLDRLLPGGGLRHGILVEWLDESGGGRAATLGLLAAREACRQGGVLVALDRAGMFYPPAAVGWGIDPARLLVVRPRSARDELWAAVQALRSPVVAAVWMRIDRLSGREFRRLQLAAEAGRTLGVLVRPAGARRQPSWAEVRLAVKGEGGRRKAEGKAKQTASYLPPSPFRLPPLQVSLVHVRGGRAGGCAWIEIDDAAHEVREAVVHHDADPLPVVAELADPAAHARPAGA